MNAVNGDKRKKCMRRGDGNRSETKTFFSDAYDEKKKKKKNVTHGEGIYMKEKKPRNFW